MSSGEKRKFIHCSVHMYMADILSFATILICFETYVHYILMSFIFTYKEKKRKKFYFVNKRNNSRVEFYYKKFFII